MNSLAPGETIVATGTFLYGDAVECDLRVVYGPIRYGSGDYEEEAEISSDSVMETYYVQYGSTTQRGFFSSGSGGYKSLAEARAAAEEAPGIGLTVRWHSGVA